MALDRRQMLVGAGATAGLLALGCRPKTPLIEQWTMRRAEDRGGADLGWLSTRYSFSFSKYQDPDHMQFRALRVMNEDYIASGGGFPTHPHKDMEIVTWVMAGALEHKDTLGNGGIIVPGQAQRMSAGTGIRHSEFNPQDRGDTHLYQIWLLPREQGLVPSYDDRPFPAEDRDGALRLLATGSGEAGALQIHSNADLFAATLRRGFRVEHEITPGRGVWVQVARGAVTVNGERLVEGDGASSEQPGKVEIAGEEDAEILLFDLA